MSALSDLLATQPMSARDAARKADGMGIHLPAGTIAAYWSGRHGRPSPDTLTRLAQVIDIPLRRLQQAAWGAEAPLGEYRPPTEANLLDDRQRRALDELIRSIVKTQGAIDGVEATTEPDAPREADPDEKTPSRDAALKAGGAAIRPRITRGSLTSNDPGPGLDGPERIDFDRADPDHILSMVTSAEGGTFTVGDLVAEAEGMTDAELVAAHESDPVGYIAQWVQARRPELLKQSDYDLTGGPRTTRGKSRGQVEYEDQAGAGEESQDHPEAP